MTVFYRLLSICGVIWITACSPIPTKQSTLNPDHTKFPIYGKLESTDNGYQFTKLSDSKIPNNEPWVRLNDMTPMWSTKVEKCFTGLAYGGSEDCKTENPELFRKTEIDLSPGGASKYVFMSALTYGLAATMPPAVVSFDQESYQKAIKEAAPSIISSQKLISSYVNYRNKIQQEYESQLAIQRRLLKNIDKNIALNDHSGFYNDSIKFEDFFIINASLNKPKGSYISPHQDEYQFSSGSLAQRLKLLNDQVSTAYITQKRQWSYSTNNYSVTCPETQYSDFYFKLTCPKKIIPKDGRLAINGQVDIKSRKFRKIIPSNYQATTNELILTMLDNKEIEVANKTEQFLSIDSISFYHNGQIASKYKLSRELPPFAEVNLFNLISVLGLGSNISWEHVSFDQLTLKKAKQQNIEYGFALKYRVIDTDREKTLYKVKNYNLADLVLK